MRKGIKILGKVVAATAVSFVVLLLLLALALQIPAVQNFAVQRVVRAVSSRLQTTVAVERVAVAFPGKVRVTGFYVEDYQRDTLLYAGRVDAFVTGIGLFGGGVELSRGELADVKLCLRETPAGEMNIKQIVDCLSNPDREKKNPFRLAIRAATIRNMELCLERQQHRDPPFGIDFGHMHLSGLTASIERFELNGSSIETDIEAFRAAERSGFVLDNLSGKFRLDNGRIEFTDANLLTAESNLFLPHILLQGGSWADYKYFVDRVRIDGSLRHSQLSVNDVAYFSPSLQGKSLVLSDLALDMEGTAADFAARILNLRIGRSTYLAADVSARGLPDFKETRFGVELSRLSTVSSDVDELVGAFARKPLSAKSVEMLAHAGAMNLAGQFRGTPSAFRVDLGAETQVGGMTFELAMQPSEKGLRSIDGNVAARNLRLGKLLERPDLFGDASLTARIDGVIGRGHADVQVGGVVERLNFNDYTYDTLRLDGQLYDKRFDGRITARDPHLDFDFTGLADFNDSVPRYDFSLDLHRADLDRLRINRRDSVSRLSARMAARSSGRSFDDMNGTVIVTDAVYQYNAKTLRVDSLTIRGKNSANSKYLELRSDFADATFRSRTNYRDAFAYLRQSAWKYLPRLNNHRKKQPEKELALPVFESDDYSQLKVDIRNFNPVADAVSPGLQIAAGSSLNLTFNPANDRLSFRAVSDYIERGDLLAIRLNANARNTKDSLVVSADAENFYAAGLHLPGLHVSGGAKDGKVEVSAGFSDTTRHFSGLFGLRAGVSDAEGPNGQVLDVRILPSRITRGEVTWRILARSIRIDTAQVMIDRFFVTSNGQHLLLDGVASRNPNDSLSLRLSNFDLAPFSQIADRMGYGIEGRTSGEATMKAVLGGGELTADIRFDSLSVNGIAGPPLQLSSRWDLARNRAGVFVTDRISRDTLVHGFYAPDRRRYYARMQVDSLDMGLLDPVLSGVVSSTKGTASVDLVLQGERRTADLTGKIDISGLRTTVDFTQVTYSVPEASLAVHGNRFTCSDVPIFDAEANRGMLDLNLNLQHLSNIGYEVRVRPDRMLVLDTDESDNDAFYGKVYATGDVRVAGDKGKVDMRITAATEGNSSFFLPMSSKTNISNADFVVFEKPQLEDTTDLLVLKRQQFERRRKRRAGAASQMNISMTLDVRPNVELELTVSGNVIRSRGTGTLNLQINPTSNVFEIYGDYTIDDGSFLFTLQNILNRKFDIESGSTIQWTGSPINAMLDIEAIYKLKTSLQPLLGSTSDRLTGDRSVNVECLIRLSDRLTDPTVTFDVRVPATDPETQAIIANALNTPETVDMQFLYLLLFKNFMAENNVASQNIGASVSYNTGLEFLTNQLSNLLSADDYSIVIRYRPKSELTGDEVDFGLSKGLINNRLFVELEGNYLIDSKQQMVNRSMSNFMGEAYITYLIDRAGTLKLKAFTQTIDRFDENQGLQETGLGIYFKEDFDNFRDFRRRVKERFTNKKRQARKAARRAERLNAKQPDPDEGQPVEPSQSGGRDEQIEPNLNRIIQ